MAKVTDPEILAKLNSPDVPADQGIDPQTLAQLNAPAPQAPIPPLIGAGQPISRPGSLQSTAQEVYGFDQNIDRSTLLPVGVEKDTGDRVLAVPNMMKNILESALLPGHVAQGGSYTPEDVTGMALDVAVPLTARGAMGPTPLARGLSRKQLIENAPTVEDLKKAGVAAKDRAVASGINVDPDRYTDLLADFETIGGMNRVDPTLHPKSTAVLNSLEKTLGQSPDVEDLNITRRLIGVAQRSIDPDLADDRRIAGLLEDRLDDFIERMGPDDVLTGDPTKISGNLKEFRTNWSRAKKSELIEDLIEKAENSASGFHNGLRVGFRSLLNNKKQMRGFSDAERQLIKDAATGKGTNLARIIGQFGISDRGTGAVGASLGGAGGAGAGALLGGPGGALAGAIAAPVVGTISRRIAQKGGLENANVARAAAATGQVPQSRSAMRNLLIQALEKATTPTAGAINDRPWPPGFI